VLLIFCCGTALAVPSLPMGRKKKVAHQRQAKNQRCRLTAHITALHDLGL
jgi:hypothetical protein